MKKRTMIKVLFVAALVALVLIYAKRFRESHKISVENEVESTITVRDIQRFRNLSQRVFMAKRP